MSAEPQLLTLVSSLAQNVEKQGLRRGLGPVATVAGQVAFNAAKSTVEAAKVMSQGQSLAKFTQRARIAPYVLIEENLRQQPYITDILQAATNIYAGYYLTAVALVGDVAGVSVLDKLDRVNPNREVDLSRVRTKMSFESFSMGLPFEGTETPAGKWGFSTATHQFTTSMEAWDPFSGLGGGKGKGTYDPNDPVYAAGGKVGGDSGKKEENQRPADHPQMARDTVLTAKEASNLACGKLLEVRVVINGATVSIPTTVVLFPNTSDSASFVHILSVHDETQTVTERWHDWRSGAKTLSDFLFMRDLVRKHRATLMKDRSGYYAAVSAQNRNSKLAAGQSKTSSLAEASNILIFSSSCAKQAEYQIGGSLDNFAVRERVFEKTQAMLMFVVDRDSEMVKIYHSGLALANELKIRELKFANKNTGPDVAEILKAYQLGNTPSF